jgi:hypothetical protein
VSRLRFLQNSEQQQPRLQFGGDQEGLLHVLPPAHFPSNVVQRHEQVPKLKRASLDGVALCLPIRRPVFRRIEVKRLIGFAELATGQR